MSSAWQTVFKNPPTDLKETPKNLEGILREPWGNLEGALKKPSEIFPQRKSFGISSQES